MLVKLMEDKTTEIPDEILKNTIFYDFDNTISDPFGQFRFIYTNFENNILNIREFILEDIHYSSFQDILKSVTDDGEKDDIVLSNICEEINQTRRKTPLKKFSHGSFILDNLEKFNISVVSYIPQKTVFFYSNGYSTENGLFSMTTKYSFVGDEVLIYSETAEKHNYCFSDSTDGLSLLNLLSASDHSEEITFSKSTLKTITDFLLEGTFDDMKLESSVREDNVVIPLVRMWKRDLPIERESILFVPILYNEKRGNINSHYELKNINWTLSIKPLIEKLLEIGRDDLALKIQVENL